MTMKQFILLLLGILLLVPLSVAQIFEKPNFALSSHPTLEIMSIEKWSDRTVVHIGIRNERLSGSFCIDPETYLLNSLGSDEYRLVSMEGIPPCPDHHRFKSIGEVLQFDLVFPPLPDHIKYIDLKEQCGEACVDLKYILLEEELNSEINRGLNLYELGRMESSLQVFEEIMAGNDNLSPVYGTIYLYLLYIHFDMGSSNELRRVYDELKASSITGRDEFIESARDSGLVR